MIERAVFWDLALHPLISIWATPVTVLELVAFVLSLWMVIGNAKVRLWAWPLAITSSVLYGLLFFHSGLFAESGLQAVFVGAALWGWWCWWHDRRIRADQSVVNPAEHTGGGQRPATITTSLATVELQGAHHRTMSFTQGGGVTLIFLLVWPVLGWILQRKTSSTVPYWDAAPAVGSLIGQYLLGKKFIENWSVWLVVNVCSIGLFWSKGLFLTALLYVLFALMSMWGWWQWKRDAASARSAHA
jgi:nicotinamide mononucleotide transporter